MAVVKYAIEVKNLSLGYANALNSNPITFTIKLGEWTGIVGQNGTGKSTLFKVLLGQLEPLEGVVTICSKKPGSNNNLIGYIPQNRELNTAPKMCASTLIKASYKANSWGIPIYNSSFKQKLKSLVNLVGIQPYLHQPLEKLSGGQLKRVFLVQALINDPKILLLDEPLSDLDPAAKQKFITSLKKIHKSREITVLIISHDMQEINKRLDKFIHFKNGSANVCDLMPCLKEDMRV